MADPATLTAISVGSTAVSSLLGAFGAQQESGGQQRMYQYQAGIAKMNQQISLQNADYSRKVGEVEAQQSGMKTRAQIGDTRVKQGASGIDVHSKSSEAVIESEQEIGQHNQAIIRSNAAKKAYGYEVEAASHEAQAGAYAIAGEEAKKAGDLKSLGSILGGASSVATKWLDAKKVGIGEGGSGYYGGSPGDNPLLVPT